MTKGKSIFRNFGDSRFADIGKRRNYYLTFTVIFLVMLLVAYGWIFFTGRSLIWNTDGMEQHYKAYSYWGEYLRKFIGNVFSNHSLSFPEWDFALGEGNDILHTLQFYVIGDPFAALSVVCPTEYMHYFYDFMILLRLYLAGITFSAMCAYVDPDGDRWGRLTGALCYGFSSWAVFSAGKHPFFLNPMVFLPLLVLGAEKIFRGDRKRTFVLAVFLSALGNFYYFYQIVLVAVIYILVRLIYLFRKQIKQLFIKLLWILLSAVFGVLMAAAIILPTLLVYLGDSRQQAGVPFQWIYESSYYTKLPGLLFGGLDISGWLCIGMAGIAIVSLILLLIRKGHVCLKIYLLISAIIMIIPAFGQIFNGMSYVANRWSWAFGLLAAFIVAVMWKELMQITQREYRMVLAGLIVCMGLILFLSGAGMKEAFIGLACTFLLMVILRWSSAEAGETGEAAENAEAAKSAKAAESAEDANSAKRAKRKILPILCLTAVNLVVPVIYYYAPGERGNVYNLKDTSRLDDLSETEVIRAQAEADGTETFYRYSGGKSWNVHTLAGLSNPGYYWSLTNPAVSDYIRQLGMVDSVIWKNWGTDRKTGVLTSGNVKYLLVNDTDENAVVPYGFKELAVEDYNKELIETVQAETAEELGKELTEEQKKNIEDTFSDPYRLYRNQYFLPFGYVTSNVITSDQWEGLKPVEKQEAMLQGVLLGEDAGLKSTCTPSFDSRKLDYTCVESSTGVTMKDNEFVVTKKGSYIKFEVEKVPDAEMYLEFDKLRYEGYPQKELYKDDGTKDPKDFYTETTWKYLTSNSKTRLNEDAAAYGGNEDSKASMSLMTSDKHQVDVNLLTPRASKYEEIPVHSAYLGYSEKGVKEIKITFSDIGTYSFDDFRVMVLPMEHYGERVKALKTYPMRNETFSEDMVEGSVTVPKEGGVLRLAIPYGDGWKAYVDGQETEILHADIKYMAISLTGGDHDICLVYQTPMLRTGLLISGASILVFLIGITVVPLVVRRVKKKEAREEA